jgi:hypothetical protein
VCAEKIVGGNAEGRIVVNNRDQCRCMQNGLSLRCDPIVARPKGKRAAERYRRSYMKV